MEQELVTFFKGKQVLVTGGTGSIGSEIVQQLLKTDIKQIRIFSRDEHKQHVLSHKLGRDRRLRFLIGNIREFHRVRKAMSGIDVAYHAAALKHVPACEYNPSEAVKTNVAGTQNVLDAAHMQGVERVVTISTDKAAAPLSVMGATKLAAEKVTTSAIYHHGDTNTRCSAVRFGNVLGSRGSVMDVFIRQIKAGKPITITAKEMTRFFMTIEDAVSLVFRATEIMKGAEVFVLKMPVIQIQTLAEVLLKRFASEAGKNPSDYKIVETGMRPGEKMHELLMTHEEAGLSLEREDMFILRPYLQFPELAEIKRTYENTKPAEPKEFSSEGAAWLKSSDVENLVDRVLKKRSA